ncbi:MAG: hypothetical protein Q8P78_02500 [bacterium]|nr:hypothetical protein [bacterium]
MLQPYLNLIPESHQKVLARERTFYLVHSVVGILVVVLAINTILLLGARFVLVNYAQTLKDDTSLVNVRHFSLQQDVKQLNKRIQDVSLIQRDFVKHSDLLDDVTTALPDGIVIDFLHVNASAKTLRITGTARDRDALVAAQQALEALPVVTSLESPLENFLERQNIAFRFNIALDTKGYRFPPQ